MTVGEFKKITQNLDGDYVLMSFVYDGGIVLDSGEIESMLINIQAKTITLD